LSVGRSWRQACHEQFDQPGSECVVDGVVQEGRSSERCPGEDVDGESQVSVAASSYLIADLQEAYN